MIQSREKAAALLERGARWFVRWRVGGEDEIRQLLDRAEAFEGDALIDEVARHVTRKATARAFLTGLVGSPWTAVPLAMIDLHGATSAEAKIAAVTALVRDPELFERRDWDREVLLAMLDLDADADVEAPGLSVAIAKRIVLHQGKRYLARTATNYVPLVGSFMGAGVEYAFLKWRTAKLREHLPEHKAAPAAIRAVDVPPAPTFDPPPMGRIDREPDLG